MSESAPRYVLDSYAVLAYFEGESGGAAVRTLVEAAGNRQAVLYLSLINAGEVYYIVCREKGLATAETLLQDLHDLPIVICPAGEERVFAAARIKAGYPLSYADAFAVALAQELKAALVTGDVEFKVVEPQVTVLWLPGK